MINEELIRNYRNTLNQKYNAVCFDIDGTLTEANSTKIDKFITKNTHNFIVSVFCYFVTCSMHITNEFIKSKSF